MAQYCDGGAIITGEMEGQKKAPEKDWNFRGSSSSNLMSVYDAPRSSP
jgi:hypothetical protein